MYIAQQGLLCALLVYYQCNELTPPDQIYKLIEELDELRASPSTQLYSDQAEAETIEEMTDLADSFNRLAGSGGSGVKMQIPTCPDPATLMMHQDQLHSIQTAVQKLYDDIS